MPRPRTIETAARTAFSTRCWVVSQFVLPCTESTTELSKARISGSWLLADATVTETASGIRGS